jgi:hypothetical protein
MTVREIVMDYLKKNGFDGLCDGPCGCNGEDCDLCAQSLFSCRPAYRWDCDVCSDREKCGKDKEYGLCYRLGKQERNMKGEANK